MKFIKKNKLTNLIDEWYLPIDTTEVVKEFLSYVKVTDENTFVLINHSHLLAEHIFVPVRYGKTTAPNYVRELERNFDADFTVPRTIYRCTNCGTYAVDSYNCITSITPIKNILKKQSLKQFRHSLHRVISMLYCGRVKKYNGTKPIEMVSWDIQNLFYSEDKVYAKAYQFYNENQLLLLDSQRKELRNIPFTLKEEFDQNKPFGLKRQGSLLDVKVISSAYMAARMLYFMHPTYNSHKVFAGQNNRRKHKYKNSFVKEK